MATATIPGRGPAYGGEGWNARDFDLWSADFTDEAVLTAPGGVSGSGPEMQRMFYAIWQDGFPDNQVTNIRIAGDGNTAVLEAVFEGTHTGVLVAPSGDIAPTGKPVAIPFVVTYTCEGGRIAGVRLYFDQLDLVTQLGL